jgi:hypothetical protein
MARKYMGLLRATPLGTSGGGVSRNDFQVLLVSGEPVKDANNVEIKRFQVDRFGQEKNNAKHYEAYMGFRLRE